MTARSPAFLPLSRASEREREGTHREAMGRVRVEQASMVSSMDPLTAALSPLAGGEGEVSCGRLNQSGRDHG